MSQYRFKQLTCNLYKGAFPALVFVVDKNWSEVFVRSRRYGMWRISNIVWVSENTLWNTRISTVYEQPLLIAF